MDKFLPGDIIKCNLDTDTRAKHPGEFPKKFSSVFSGYYYIVQGIDKDFSDGKYNQYIYLTNSIFGKNPESGYSWSADCFTLISRTKLGRIFYG